MNLLPADEALVVWDTLVQLLRDNESARTAVLVAVRGHHARKPGARLLVRAGGSSEGSVGGGVVEAAVREKAPRFLDLWPCVLLNLPGEEGAEVTVFLEAWQPEPLAQQLAERLAAVETEGAPLALVTLVTGGLDGAVLGSHLLVDERGERIYTLGRADLDAEAAVVAAQVLQDRTARLVELAQGDEMVFVEPVLPSPLLVVFGVGHVARALAHVAAYAGFMVMLVDGRPPEAEEVPSADAEVVRVADAVEFARALPMGRNTCVAVMTHSHALDEALLRVLLPSPAGYVGMLGSRAKISGMAQRLQQSGMPAPEWGRLHTPIGLDIGAETPEEIAVSVVAELIQAWRGQRRPVTTKTTREA